MKYIYEINHADQSLSVQLIMIVNNDICFEFDCLYFT